MSSLAFTAHSANTTISANATSSANTTMQSFYNTAYHTARKPENSACSQPWQGQWLGRSKSQVLQILQDENLASIGFASWLAVPSLRILLKFHHQICQNMTYY